MKIIWLYGALLSLSVFFFRYIHEIRKLNRYPSEDGVYIVPGCKTPMGIGVFKKRILLPRQDYTEQELRYILLHEETHFAHHDQLVKMLMQVLCCIFWWNPFVYLLQKAVSQMLEIRCDREVAKSADREEYMAVLLALVKDGGGSSAMVERFQRIAGRRSWAHRGRASVLAAAFVLVCAGPALVKPPMREARQIVTTPTGQYKAVFQGDVEMLGAEDGTHWMMGALPLDTPIEIYMADGRKGIILCSSCEKSPAP